MPKAVQAAAKAALQQIWIAETRAEAIKAFDRFVATYEAKYPKATGCLEQDRDELLAFYDFPAEHWKHLRTTNPIESTFATVKLRTKKTKGSGSRAACLTMVFQLARSAERQWRAFSAAPSCRTSSTESSLSTESTRPPELRAQNTTFDNCSGERSARARCEPPRERWISRIPVTPLFREAPK